MRYVTRASEKPGRWEVYDTAMMSVVLSAATPEEAGRYAGELNDVRRRAQVTRYTAWPGMTSGRWYIFDTEKNEIVWSVRSEAKAVDLVLYLNEISQRNPEKEPVPEKVAQRLMLFAAVCDVKGVEFEDRAEDAGRRGDTAMEKEHSREAQELRQRSRDLYLLLEAAGVQLER